MLLCSFPTVLFCYRKLCIKRYVVVYINQEVSITPSTFNVQSLLGPASLNLVVCLIDVLQSLTRKKKVRVSPSIMFKVIQLIGQSTWHHLSLPHRCLGMESESTHILCFLLPLTKLQMYKTSSLSLSLFLTSFYSQSPQLLPFIPN